MIMGYSSLVSFVSYYYIDHVSETIRLTYSISVDGRIDPALLKYSDWKSIIVRSISSFNYQKQDEGDLPE